MAGAEVAARALLTGRPAMASVEAPAVASCIPLEPTLGVTRAATRPASCVGAPNGASGASALARGRTGVAADVGALASGSVPIAQAAISTRVMAPRRLASLATRTLQGHQASA